MSLRGDKLTLIMPTRETMTQFITRGLEWYNPQGLFPLVRMSDAETFFECTLNLLRVVKTPYVVIAADDDFLLPEGLIAAVHWLETNPDYAVAHGRALQFGIKGNGPYGEIEWVAPYKQSRRLERDGKDRVLNHWLNYQTTCYSVHRTKDLTRAYEYAVHLRLDPHLAELATSLDPIYRGKAAKLSVPYMMRQIHPNMTSQILGGAGETHHPPIRTAAQYYFPEAFRWIQFRLRAGYCWNEFNQVREFLNASPSH